jgi:hypothetical protein
LLGRVEFVQLVLRIDRMQANGLGNRDRNPTVSAGGDTRNRSGDISLIATGRIRGDLI